MRNLEQELAFWRRILQMAHETVEYGQRSARRASEEINNIKRLEYELTKQPVKLTKIDGGKS